MALLYFLNLWRPSQSIKVQISDLEKQNAVKDAVIASQHEMHNRTLEFVFEKYGADTSSKIAADSPIADILDRSIRII